MQASIYGPGETDGADDDGFGDFDWPGGFYVFTADFDMSPAAGFCGERPGFEEADGPKPFIDSDGLNWNLRRSGHWQSV